METKCVAKGKSVISEVLTVRLKGGREVVAKKYKGELSAIGYGNRTQAQNKAAKLGEGWAVCRSYIPGYGITRPFYVGKVEESVK